MHCDHVPEARLIASLACFPLLVLASVLYLQPGLLSKTAVKMISFVLSKSLLFYLLSSAIFTAAVPVERNVEYLTSGKNGGVACEVAECSDIGIDILAAGGNAVDSIIATTLCVGTIAAFHSGIGGGMA